MPKKRVCPTTEVEVDEEEYEHLTGLADAALEEAEAEIAEAVEREEFKYIEVWRPGAHRVTLVEYMEEGGGGEG